MQILAAGTAWAQSKYAAGAGAHKDACAALSRTVLLVGMRGKFKRQSSLAKEPTKNTHLLGRKQMRESASMVLHLRSI